MTHLHDAAPRGHRQIPAITRRNSCVSCVGVSGSKSLPRNSVCLRSEARGPETQEWGVSSRAACGEPVAGLVTGA